MLTVKDENYLHEHAWTINHIIRTSFIAVTDMLEIETGFTGTEYCTSSTFPLSYEELNTISRVIAMSIPFPPIVDAIVKKVILASFRPDEDEIWEWNMLKPYELMRIIIKEYDKIEKM